MTSKEEKQKVGPSGGSPSSWVLYERVNSILGGYKFCNLEETVEESIDLSYCDVEFIDEDTNALSEQYLSENIFDDTIDSGLSCTAEPVSKTKK
ncbi:uncharacterized protein isoform X2 [Musca autumnalis]|uniref:uncharacterized protein isoform X2 n=1 Tax=Musca autumnalis TaxID=221902 RepID=UPI003CF35CDF